MNKMYYVLGFIIVLNIILISFVVTQPVEIENWIYNDLGDFEQYCSFDNETLLYDNKGNLIGFECKGGQNE